MLHVSSRLLLKSSEKLAHVATAGGLWEFCRFSIRLQANEIFRRCRERDLASGHETTGLPSTIPYWIRFGEPQFWIGTTAEYTNAAH